MPATLNLYLTSNGATTWAASTAYAVGDRVYPTTKNGYVYECTVAGTSGAAEPAWPTAEGQTVTDGTVTWQAVSEPNNSLGGAAGTTQVSTTAMNNIFDNVSPSEASGGDTEYRAVDLVNDGDATATGVQVWIDPNTTSPDTVLELGVEASPLNSVTQVADESTAPAGVAFSQAGPGAEISLPDIPAGQYARLWLRRTVTAGAGNTANDSATLNWQYA